MTKEQRQTFEGFTRAVAAEHDQQARKGRYPVLDRTNALPLFLGAADGFGGVAAELAEGSRPDTVRENIERAVLGLFWLWLSQDENTPEVLTDGR
jgi:hypothetical protein